MATVIDNALHQQLIDRRRKLESAVSTLAETDDLVRLLRQVDGALDRMNAGTYGLCEACNDSIEADRLIADPCVRFCLDHLTASQQRALEEDWVRQHEVKPIEANGLPIGIFSDERYSVSSGQLSPGDILFLYTDGLSEARDRFGGEYGTERLSRWLEAHSLSRPENLLDACVQNLNSFRDAGPKTDDLTLMVTRRGESQS